MAAKKNRQKIEVPSEIRELGDYGIARFMDWCETNGGPPSGRFQLDMAIWYSRQRACGTKNTDRAFLQGSQCGGDFANMPPGVAKKIARLYKKHTGRSLPKNARYNSQVARFPGDPMAVVSDIGDLKRAAINAGKAYEDVGIKAREVAPPDLNKKKLGGMLLRRRMAKELRKPENFGKKPQEIKERIIDKHGYNAHE